MKGEVGSRARPLGLVQTIGTLTPAAAANAVKSRQQKAGRCELARKKQSPPKRYSTVSYKRGTK